MLARLGIVIYWLGWIVAGIFILGGLLAGELAVSLIVAFAAWAIGYKCRSILAEPKPTQSKTNLLRVAGAINTGNVTATVGDKLVPNWHGTPTQRDKVLKMFPVIRDKMRPGLELEKFADVTIASIHDNGMSPDNEMSNIQTIAMLWRVFTAPLDDGRTYGDLVAHANMHAAFELHEQINDQFKVTWKISVMRGRTP